MPSGPKTTGGELALRNLLLANASGKLAPRHSTGGYLVEGQKRCGVVRFLRQKLGLYGGHGWTKKDRNKKKKGFFGRGSGGGGSVLAVRASTKRSGSAFHRHAYHALFCSQKRRCDCKRAFGSATRSAPKKGTPCYDLVREALVSLDALKFRPVCGEQVVASHQLPLATQFDLMCRDERDQLVLVSWKVQHSFL